MRRITACMAALISILVVFASISASACDLSCWLRQGQADCHPGMSVSGGENAASMAASMAMPMGAGPDGMQHMMASDAGVGTLLSTALPDHSRNFSFCAYGTCGQLSFSASPPGTGHAQPQLLSYAPARSSVVTTSWTRGDRIKTGSPPPSLHTEPLATILRL